MSGLGRKVFTAGEVLTAANVNGYLMDQSVMVFDDSGARGSAIGTATEGMVAYIKNENPAVQVFDGTQWTAVASQSPNYIINGAFDIWQRGTSFGENVYTADRWRTITTSGDFTVTQQTFTPGDIEAASFGDARFYLKMDATVGANFQGVMQRIEDVKTLAGQTVTLSFWAKGVNPGELTAAQIIQIFGTGGSANVVKQNNFAMTTEWQRFSLTFNLDSVDGKTIGANSYLEIYFRQTIASSDPWELNIWGVQLEAGSIATPFRRNANSIQGELAACQRYYYRTDAVASFASFGIAFCDTTTQASSDFKFPVKMRTAPTFASAGNFRVKDAGVARIPTLSVNNQTADNTRLTATTTSLTTGRAVAIEANSDATAYLEFSAEL